MLPVPDAGGIDQHVRAAGPKRVLFVAACPFPCARGTPARILGQATALARLGLDIHIVTYHLSEGPPPPGVTIHRIPRVPTYRRLHAGPTLQKLLVLDPLLLARTVQVARALRPHLLHGHHVEGGITALLAGALLRVPAIFDAHTSLKRELPFYAPPALAPLLSTLGSRVELAVAGRSRHVITTTDALRDHFLEDSRGGLRSEAVTPIPTPLDSLDFLEHTARVGQGNENEPHRIIYTGSLAPFQGVELLHRAFEQVREELPSTELLIVSSDPTPETLPGRESTPGIRYAQAQDLRTEFELLGTADVAVSPRIVKGGLPQKLLNYMRVGLPIVASEGSGDILRHGDTGWITPNGDPGAMADALLHLLRNPELRELLGENARRDAADRFGWKRIADDMLGVYRAVLGSHGRAATG